MPKLTLVPQTLKTLPAVGGARTDYIDEEQVGLVFRVSGPAPKQRVFYFMYKARGRKRRYRLGSMADGLGLSAARARVRKLRGQVAEGNDPQAEKRTAHASDLSFGELADSALEAIDEQVSPNTMREWRRVYDVAVKPRMGNLLVEDRPALRRECWGLAHRQKSKWIGNRVVEVCYRVWSWVERNDRDGRFAGNPFSGIPKPLPTKDKRARTRLYSADELRAIWKGVKGTRLHDVVPLLLWTGARPGELRKAEWREFELGDAATWTIPPENSKITDPRIVPLTKPAVERLKEIQDRGESIRFVFPAGRRSGHQEQDSAVVEQVREACGVADFRPHDLRRCVRSGLSELGVPSEIAELALGHMPAKLVRTYNPYPGYWRIREVRSALVAWAARLEELLSEADLPPDEPSDH